MKFYFFLIFLFSIVKFSLLRQDKPLEKSILDGAEIYKDFCVQCHLSNGNGVSGVFPPLAKSDYLFNDVDRSIRGIKYGLSGPIVVNEESYDGVMAYQGLDNEEIADVMNFILNSWGNKYEKKITPIIVANVNE